MVEDRNPYQISNHKSQNFDAIVVNYYLPSVTDHDANATSENCEISSSHNLKLLLCFDDLVSIDGRPVALDAGKSLHRLWSRHCDRLPRSHSMSHGILYRCTAAFNTCAGKRNWGPVYRFRNTYHFRSFHHKGMTTFQQKKRFGIATWHAAVYHDSIASTYLWSD